MPLLHITFDLLQKHSVRGRSWRCIDTVGYNDSYKNDLASSHVIDGMPLVPDPAVLIVDEDEVHEKTIKYRRQLLSRAKVVMKGKDESFSSELQQSGRNGQQLQRLKQCLLHVINNEYNGACQEREMDAHPIWPKLKGDSPYYNHYENVSIPSSSLSHQHVINYLRSLSHLEGVPLPLIDIIVSYMFDHRPVILTVSLSLSLFFLVVLSNDC
jgi:hypothetical protein